LTPPVLTVIAGANGAGKSTLARAGLEMLGGVHIIDPDFAEPYVSPIRTGRIVVAWARNFLRDRKSFGIETTLAGKHALYLMQDAKAAGYEIQLLYVGTSDVKINLRRIAQRVAAGGHDVPEVDVRRRYVRSMQKAPAALKLADRPLCSTTRRRLTKSVPAASPSWQTWTAGAGLCASMHCPSGLVQS
jgi:predicted ABC-type ATPase